MNPRFTESSRRAASGTDRSLRAVLRRLADTCRDPAHMIELYYWSAEPELISALRRYIALPDAPREAIHAFLTMTADCPETVQVSVSQEGHVTLYSPTVADIMQKTAIARVNDKREAPVH